MYLWELPQHKQKHFVWSGRVNEPLKVRLEGRNCCLNPYPRNRLSQVDKEGPPWWEKMRKVVLGSGGPPELENGNLPRLGSNAPRAEVMRTYFDNPVGLMQLNFLESFAPP
jgi:hypothetical protein